MRRDHQSMSSKNKMPWDKLDFFAFVMLRVYTTSV